MSQAITAKPDSHAQEATHAHAPRAPSQQSARLPAQRDEWIDRSKPLHFTFEGEHYTGYQGDTIASALLANGVRVLGRSFKYHRPRGVLSLANHDVNALMQIGAQLNVRADVTALEQGMVVYAVNTSGGLKHDRGRIFDWLSPILPVGFYYKAFHTPKAWFPHWERLIRESSGLGAVDFATPHLRTPKRYAFCDVLVVGAGVSGLSAALSAAQAGARVCVVDENAKAGGSAFFNRGGNARGVERLRDLLAQVAAQPNIELRLATEASGYYADHWVGLTDAKRMTKMRARCVIFATGAFEQPAVFRNNDLPGVMLASAAQRLLHRYAVKPMSHAVVLTANSDGYRAALDLIAAGIRVEALADLRAQGEGGSLRERARDAGVPVFAGACVYEALPAFGGGRVKEAVIAQLDTRGEVQPGRMRRVPCDGIVMSVGWVPALNLLYQAGMKPDYEPSVEQFVPDQLPEGIFACGRVNGVFDLEDKIQDGDRAGQAAARFLGVAADDDDLPVVPRSSAQQSHPYPFVAHPKGKNFVDFDEDLQLKDFANAAQEGFDSIELMKRYTTVGMGPSQGKHSNMNAVRILARLKGKAISEIGTTTARPFFHPVPMSHLAGRGFSPERLTPMHEFHTKAGAKFMQAGGWLRPEYYSVAGLSKLEAIRQEARTVRQSLGLIDVGTLGKLEVYGAQAAEFLGRVYTGRFANLKVGMTRYCLMLDDSGVVIDDGVVARLGEQHFYFTTTTTNSALIYRELSRLNTMWRMQVGIVNVTGAYAAMNLAGPKSREALRALTSIDVSDSAFPYLGAREGEVAGVAARLLRVGFVGELGYEIHVPAQCGAQLWHALMQTGAAYQIRPFGVEAQRLLRLEKGHIIIGQDTDGLTTPLEAHLGWALRMDKPFFVGQRSLKIVEKQELKQVLVGFALPADFAGVQPKECHLVIERGEISGRVTSIAYSESVGRVIGLAFVHPSLSRLGGKFSIRADGGAVVEAEVVKTPFYDPDSQRQRE